MKELRKIPYLTLIVTFVFSCASIIAQENEKLIFFKVLENNAFDFFLDDVGTISIISKAKYIRNTSIDKNSFNFNGKTEDLLMDGKIIYQYRFDNGSINGEVSSFYNSGKLKYKGIKRNSVNDSVWNYFYPNGQKEKVIQFSFDMLNFKEYYQKTGNQFSLMEMGDIKAILHQVSIRKMNILSQEILRMGK